MAQSIQRRIRNSWMGLTVGAWNTYSHFLAKLADGSILEADGQLAGTPSVMFDAIAVILSDEGANLLTRESAAIDFVHNAFGHLKAIAVDKGGQELLQKANIERDKGVVDLIDIAGFISAAKTRQWDREPSVRILA